MEKPLIYFVEDDRVYAAFLQKQLEAHGYRCLHDSSGEEAQRKIREKQPDLVLLDIGLPTTDGFEILKRIRDDSDTYRIPVMMLSRLSEREDIARAFALGANQYLIKMHHTPSDILGHIDRQLRIAVV